MIYCPECDIKLTPYCTKTKIKTKKRYYKCPVCSKTFVTTVIEVEEMIEKNKKGRPKIHLP